MANLSLFGQRIKQLRQELGLSQRDFAEKIGVTASALSAYEKGEKNPSVNVAINIAIEFDVSMDWLCGLKSNSSKFKPDEYIPFDLPEALSYLLTIIDYGLLWPSQNNNNNPADSDSMNIECEPNYPTSQLDIRSKDLRKLLFESDQLEHLFLLGSLSSETYSICLDELIYAASDSIQKTAQKKAEAD